MDTRRSSSAGLISRRWRGPNPVFGPATSVQNWVAMASFSAKGAFCFWERRISVAW